MRCKYCFYFDEIEGRDIKSFGFMPDEVLHNTISKALDGTYSTVTFLFQGGEPTLCGLDFFKKVVTLEKLYNKKNIVINNSLQTNGYRISKELLNFFKQENFLIGISLDGTKDIHNKYRGNKLSDSFDSVYNTLKYAQSIGLFYTVLTVVTDGIVDNLDEVYNFYKKENFLNLHFIPCLKPIYDSSYCDDYSLNCDKYEKYLKKIFKLWFDDIKKGFYVSIRHIDNYLMLLLNKQCESCAMQGKCSVQYLVEGNGNVYPCDFYAMDEYYLGNIKDYSFKQLSNTDTALKFVNESLFIPENCTKCNVYEFCRNGCKRDRFKVGDKFTENMYCKAYKNFLEENLSNIKQALSLLMQR